MQSSKRRVGAVAVLVAAATIAASFTGAAASSGGSTFVPFSSLFRTCSHDQTHWVSATGYGSGGAEIGVGPGGVTADVRLATAQPNTRYTVRLIEVPRPSERTCTAGDPGVIVGDLFTDASGSGTTRLAGPVVDGATGVWVSVDGPPKPGRVIGDFYTSEIVAPLN
ncbi:hypothetical protein A5724_28250 [Mycobacterium sp. ACS1612]|uniref:hypothetical protein n=1 Tax=Mycobacterium sp. ACS1612 TaxID=1834117 RepID=UPI0007FE3082|nr:hypothetical protein [Mycobacterium sp. ACS1612]OBF28307.1 hypothetical protein A5724_28250 [Mycobacterium sp. ACS1612]